eukprot:CAMPEP_0194227626 /NCGR_PEP_ID=MMETSP0156-20130528/42957_1 /TAXON_ID=33649 /ORGANISM="Thalassionema nitzschioides, Strain L26-B" /LENGTH=421 /DNA_ID=CAMNT_0038960113 /DNA_START=42 /DNA_END=1304 /DNA_ORIENTATION=-
MTTSCPQIKKSFVLLSFILLLAYLSLQLFLLQYYNSKVLLYYEWKELSSSKHKARSGVSTKHPLITVEGDDNDSNKNKNEPKKESTKNDENDDGPYETVALMTTNNDDDDKSSSLLLNEIDEIIHDRNEAKIVIRLKKEKNDAPRHCHTPRFFGRLSGPAVALIQWEKPYAVPFLTAVSNNLTTAEGDNASTTINTKTTRPTNTSIDEIVGYYQVPSTGRYFIEIISLFCNDIVFDDNFQHACMENPKRHRVTVPSAQIEVIQITNTNNALPLAGYWKWNNSTTMTNDTHRTTPATTPLYTRYQPHNCREARNLDTTRCWKPMKEDRFDPYYFDFHDDNTLLCGNNNTRNGRISCLEEKIQARILNPTSKSKISLCFVGCSHSRNLNEKVEYWLYDRWNLNATTNADIITAHHVQVKFPRS